MSDDKAATSRRDFLKLASVTAPAVAVVAVTGAAGVFVWLVLAAGCAGA